MEQFPKPVEKWFDSNATALIYGGIPQLGKCLVLFRSMVLSSEDMYGEPQFGAIALKKNLPGRFHSDIILPTEQFDILDAQQSERCDTVRFEICEVPQLRPSPRLVEDSFVLSYSRLQEPRDIKKSLSSNLIHALGLDFINCRQNSGASRLSPRIGESRVL